MKNYIKILIPIFIAFLIFKSCKDEENNTSTDTNLISFSILNAGINDDVRAEGIINDADKIVEVRVPFETNLTKLKFIAEVSQGAHIAPNPTKIIDFTKTQPFLVVNGMNNSEYKISVIKNNPTVATLMTLELVNESNTEYRTVINYKKDSVNVYLFTGNSTKVKVKNIQVGPAGATYQISGIDANGFFDLKDKPEISVTQNGFTKVYKVIQNQEKIGADFSIADYIDLTSIKNSFPAVLSGGNNRDAHYSNGITYVPSRFNGNNIYFWENSKVIASNFNPGTLKTTGMNFSQTVWGISSVYLVGNKIYVASMSNTKNQKLKIWYWENKDSEPIQILDYTIEDPVSPATRVRLGDAMSVILDNQGNGKIYLSNFPFQNANNQIYTFDITAFKTVNSNPKILDLNLQNSNIGQYGRVNKTHEPNKLVVTGADMGIGIMNENGVLEYVVPINTIPNRAQDAHIFMFNNARYLAYTINNESQANGVKGQIIDITEGGNIVDALKKLNPTNIASKTVYSNDFGSVRDTWISATTSYEVLDNQLTIMNYSSLNGISIKRFNFLR